MNSKRLAKFLIITFLISWIAWCGLAALTSLNIIPFSHPLGTILHIIGGFGPVIATLFVLEEKNTIKSIVKYIFKHRKKSLNYLFLFSVFEILTISLSSREFNAALKVYLIPLIFLQATFIYGGEEELGWRGVMQPLLEKQLNFPISAIITGTVWGIWHIPLWFINGSSQQNMPFTLFLVLAIILSFWLATIYKKTKCIFACSVFHGLTNTLLSMFIIKLNIILIIGVIAMLMRECGICFYKQLQEIQFMENNENYSMQAKAFAHDASGGEFVFLEDESIGFIGSEGEVGRIAESLAELLTFLIHAGNLFDFNCKKIYQRESLLRAFCEGYLAKIREEYHKENKDWDKIRWTLAEELSLPFHPEQLADVAMQFYKAAIREPSFSCKYMDGMEEYTCDSLLSDTVGMWVKELSGMTKKEMENNHEHL